MSLAQGCPRRLRARLAAAALVLLLLPALAPAASASFEPSPTREPTALAPLSLSVPYAWRTMEGLQTSLISPAPAYDHLHDLAWAPDGHMAIAVGSHDTLVGWDPANRTARTLRNGTLGNLYGVAWSDDSSTALAVGWGGALVEYNSSGISDLPPEGTAIWEGVTWVPGSGFLVVGTGGSMFYLNGATRTTLMSPTTSDLLAVAYSSSLGHSVAVGRLGTVVEVTPAGATALLAAPVADDLRSIGFESDTGKGLIAGGAGVLLAYLSGTVVNETHAATNGGYYDLAVTSSNEPAVVAVRNATTGSILFTNATFSNWLILGSGLTGVEAVARSPTEGYVLATGFFGMFVLVGQNGTWQNVSEPFRPSLLDGSWRPAGDLALLVGLNSTVLLFDRTTNVTTAVPVPSANVSLRGVSWAPNGTEAIIVGSSAFWRFDPASGNISEPLGPVARDLYGVAFRPNGSDAIVVGASGYVGRWDGANLSANSLTGATQTFLTARWHLDASGSGDYAYAAGANIVARYDPPSSVTTVARIGTFFGVAFLGDDVWIVGDPRQIQVYDSATGVWDNLTLPADFNTVHFARAVTHPSGDRLLVVGNQTLSAYVNKSRILRFDTGFLASFNGVAYNPATREPLFFGASRLAFSFREGTFPNLPPSVVVSSPTDESNWTTADTVSFDAGSSFDPDGDALVFSWWDNRTGFLTAAASFGAQLAAGDHTVTVYVDDGHGHNLSVNLSVHVSVAQYPPVAVIDSPSTPSNFSDDDNITFSGLSSHDPNVGDPLSFLWASDRDGVIGNSSIVVAKLSAGTHTVTLRVTDSTNRTSNATLVLVIRQGDIAPSPSITSPKPGVVYASNIAILFDAAGTTDPDSAVLSYTWLSDGLAIGSSSVFNTTLPPGTHLITLIVSDGAKSTQLNISLIVGGPLDLPPRFLSIAPGNGTVLVGFAVLNGTMEDDPIGQVRTVEVRIELGPWLSASGTLRWTVAIDTTLLPNGPLNITLRASDGKNVTEEARRYLVDNPIVNEPPTLEVLSPASGALVRGIVTVEGSATDPDSAGLTVEFRVGDGDWTNATVTGGSWSATVDTGRLPNGPVVFVFRAFDGANYSSSAYLTVNVDNPRQGGGLLPGFESAFTALGLCAAAASLRHRRRPPRI